jgi:biopolymer transport protein ExbD
MATLTASSGSRRKSTTIDMTPMVDLAFLLLTFFVLTTTLYDPFVLRLDMPEKLTNIDKQKPIKAEKVLTLVLGAQGKIYWYIGVANGKAEITNFSGNGVRKILSDKKAKIENLHVLIKASDQSQYKNLIDVLDEMIIGEIERYTIVEMEKPDKELLLSAVDIH